MKTITCIVAGLFSISCFGQTKLISFRSHSGNNAHFRTAVENSLFDIGNSNFGIIPFTERIDTVIMISRDRIIVKMKKYHSEPGYAIYFRDTLTKANAGALFTTGNIDSLKAVLHEKYIRALLDSTLFIGFDKQSKRKIKSPGK